MQLQNLLLILATALLACAQGEDAPARRSADARADASLPLASSGTTADTKLRRFTTPEEALAAFRVGLVAPTRLSGGAESREALIRRFARAVERRDTTAIRAMVIDRAEFAYLYYPSSPYTRPPTVQEAPLAWFLLVQNSQKGVTRVFNRFGGQRAEYAGHRCDPEPSREGDNVFWRECIVDLKTRRDGIVTRKLFGSIIERDGRFKFFSYSNDF